MTQLTTLMLFSGSNSSSLASRAALAHLARCSTIRLVVWAKRPSRTSPSRGQVSPRYVSALAYQYRLLISSFRCNVQQWIDNQVLNDGRSMSPPSNSDLSSGGSPPLHHLQVPTNMSSPPISGGSDDEIIPTAIVIKNIPFNVKRETLLDIIVRILLGL